MAALAGALHRLNDKSQEHVEGEVRLKLYKGNVTVIGRESPKSLYSSGRVTFDDDKGAYDQKGRGGVHQSTPCACARWGCPTGGSSGAGAVALKLCLQVCFRPRS